MLKVFSKFLDINQKELNRLSKVVDKINAFEPKVKKLKKGDFTKKTEEFKKQVITFAVGLEFKL